MNTGFVIAVLKIVVPDLACLDLPDGCRTYAIEVSQMANGQKTLLPVHAMEYHHHHQLHTCPMDCPYLYFKVLQTVT